MSDPAPSSITAPNPQSARQRLDRLDGYLREDPTNNALLIDAFESALSCGEWERALFHLRHGQTLHAEPLAWRLREGDFWLAQQRYEEAQAVLQSLVDTPHAPAEFGAVLAHNLAFVEFRRGLFSECVTRLAPLVEGANLPSSSDAVSPAVATRALHQLWLRALHHDGQLTRAMTWAAAAEAANGLDACTAGIASLIAIDAADSDMAKRWSEASIAQTQGSEPPVEALVARASIALAMQKHEEAANLADAALLRLPEDGRSWSARAFAHLLANELVSARTAFMRALNSIPRHIGTWHGLGWTQIREGDLVGARRSFDSALELDRNFAESHGGLAVVLAMQQFSTDADRHATLALKLDRANLSGRYAKALLAGEIKDAADLQRLAQRLLGRAAAPFGGQMVDLLSVKT